MISEIDAEAAKGLYEKERRRRLRRAQRDSFFLATEILNLGWNDTAGGDESPFPGKGLSEELHQKLFEWRDARRNRLLVFQALPRWHHKTTDLEIEIIQELLRNPNMTMFYFHAVDELAEMVLADIAIKLQHNPKLRELEPIGRAANGEWYDVLPPVNAKRWASLHELRVNREIKSGWPSVYARGAEAETSGYHCRKGFLDDIINRKVVEENRIPNVTNWLENTVMPVVDDGFIRARGTRWDIGAPYEGWLEDPDWCTVMLPSSVRPEDDFIEDPSRVDWTKDKIVLQKSGDDSRPIYGPLSYRPTQIKKLQHFRKVMKQNYAPQMENDPTLPGEKPWKPTYERFITRKDAQGPGIIIVLGDPAPEAIGSLSKSPDARRRKDGDKDDWAWAVVKLRAHGERLDSILLDGSYSKGWNLNAGFAEGIRLNRKWGTPYSAIETHGYVDLEAEQQKVAMQLGVIIANIPIKSTQTGKNAKFSVFCGRAASGEFWICDESCDKEFLREWFSQVRGWRPNSVGGNGLRHDDCAEVVTFAYDPGVLEYEPAIEPKKSDWDIEVAGAREKDFPQRSRYGIF